MNSYLCHGCASERNILGEMPNTEILINNNFQLEKYIKHTVPSSYASYNTVFIGVGSDSYRSAIVNAYMSGGVEQDKINRTNIVWVGSESNGLAYEGGNIVGITHGVKVVLSHDENKLHAFPISANNLREEVCSVCGNLVIL